MSNKNAKLLICTWPETTTDADTKEFMKFVEKNFDVEIEIETKKTKFHYLSELQSL